ncbi:MAG: 50S ribosomal protein L23 [Deltaproteobacteria bacterium]|nr:50S ribosomal protein L23 [Deltaproteobacteria bacterium]MCB9787367.1 50S ribosomal protein L23 [Deltaproteobacteria bacterium]
MNATTFGILKRPVVTEKSNRLREEYNQFVFEVAPAANKIEIRAAVEKLFNVPVTDVKTMMVRGRIKRFKRGYGKQPNWKKAIVTVEAGHSIDLFEGI